MYEREQSNDPDRGRAWSQEIERRDRETDARIAVTVWVIRGCMAAIAIGFIIYKVLS